MLKLQLIKEIFYLAQFNKKKYELSSCKILRLQSAEHWLKGLNEKILNC